MKKKTGLLPALKVLSSATFGTSLFVIPYLCANFISFGHFLSVSAWVKLSYPTNAAEFLAPLDTLISQSLPQVTKYLFGASLQPSAALLLILVPGLLLALFLIARRKEVRVALRLFSPIADFMGFAALHFVFIYYTAPGEALFSFWYYQPEILAVGLLVGVLVSHSCFRSERLFVTGSLIFLVILQFFLYPSFVRNKTITWARLEVAEFVKSNLPRNARLIMFDSGIVSYFSQRDAVSSSGLIGDFEMARLSKAHDFDAVIKRYRITHIIDDDQMPSANGPILFHGTIPVAYDQHTQPKVITVSVVGGQ